MTHGGQDEGGGSVGAEEEQQQKTAERESFAGQHLPASKREWEQDEEVCAIREEHLPMHDADRAHGREGEQDKEEVVLYRAPERALRVLRLQEEREHQARCGDRGERAHDGGDGVALVVCRVRIEEAAEEVGDQRA